MQCNKSHCFLTATLTYIGNHGVDSLKKRIIMLGMEHKIDTVKIKNKKNFFFI